LCQSCCLYHRTLNFKFYLLSLRHSVRPHPRIINCKCTKCSCDNPSVNPSSVYVTILLSYHWTMNFKFVHVKIPIPYSLRAIWRISYIPRIWGIPNLLLNIYNQTKPLIARQYFYHLMDLIDLLWLFTFFLMRKVTYFLNDWKRLHKPITKLFL